MKPLNSKQLDLLFLNEIVPIVFSQGPSLPYNIYKGDNFLRYEISIAGYEFTYSCDEQSSIRVLLFSGRWSHPDKYIFKQITTRDITLYIDFNNYIFEDIRADNGILLINFRSQK